MALTPYCSVPSSKDKTQEGPGSGQRVGTPQGLTWAPLMISCDLICVSDAWTPSLLVRIRSHEAPHRGFYMVSSYYCLKKVKSAQPVA